MNRGVGGGGGNMSTGGDLPCLEQNLIVFFIKKFNSFLYIKIFTFVTGKFSLDFPHCRVSNFNDHTKDILNFPIQEVGT